MELANTRVRVGGIHGDPVRAFAYMDKGRAAALGLGGLANTVAVVPRPGTTSGTLERALFGRPGIASVRPAAAGPVPPSRFYNAAFLVKPDGTIGGIYRKMHLVPFGEYVPFKRLLFFVGPIVEAVSDFSPGTEPVMLPVGSHQASTAICYEVIYPDLIRRFVRDGSELLTTITNDAWYGRSSAAYQHWEQASMRAIEGGRFLARAANTGISGFVDPYGRVLARTDLFEPAVVVRDVRFLTDQTIYSRIGDAVAWTSLAVTTVALLAARRRRLRRA